MKKVMVFLFAVYMMSAFPACAADAEYRFTHNDHDTLIIGEITELGDDTLVIKAVDYVVSAKDLNANDRKKQLRPDTVSLTSESVRRIREQAEAGWGSRFEVGDNVVASLNKKGGQYGVAWGFFKADGTDYKTLSVEAYSPMSTAMFKDFINSKGQYTEFAFDGGANTVKRVESDGANSRMETVIYQGTDDNPDSVSANAANEPADNPGVNHAPYIACGIAGGVLILLFITYGLKKYFTRGKSHMKK